MVILDKYPWCNNRGASTDLFIVWLSRCCHIQISHLRELKMYPHKFDYRINKLTADQLRDLNKLLSLIDLQPFSATSPSTRSLDGSAYSTIVVSPVKPDPKAKSDYEQIDEVLKAFGVESSSSSSAQPSIAKPATSAPSPMKERPARSTPSPVLDSIFDAFLPDDFKRRPCAAVV